MPSGKASGLGREVISEIDRLLEEKTDEETASELNKQGYKTGTARTFTRILVANIRIKYKLKSHFTRLREAGMLTEAEIAKKLGLCTKTVEIWRSHGLLRVRAYNEKPQYLYESVDNNGPVQRFGIKLSERQPFSKTLPNPIDEVQDEA